MRAIIFCAGKIDEWFSADPKMPKHALAIDGEAIIDRTVRQLRERRVEDIVIVANDERLKVDGCGFFVPENCQYFADTLLSTRSLWKFENVGILGDVFFTDEAMDIIVSTPIIDDHITFCRLTENMLYGSCAENFAMKWREGSRDFITSYEVARKSVEERKDGLNYITPPACTFQAARWACGLDRVEVHNPMRLYGHPRIVDIHDWTDDFNDEGEFLHWKAHYDKRWLSHPSAEELKKSLVAMTVA